MPLASVFKSSPIVSWRSIGKLQQTVASCIERTGSTLHSGGITTVRIWPELAGQGRYFELLRSKNVIPARIECARQSPLCTTLFQDQYSVRTVEHLLSALEACGVDNCRIEVEDFDSDDSSVEVPIFDGSAREWVEAIEEVGLKEATDQSGRTCEKLAPFLNEPVHAWKNDSFVAAFPCSKLKITYIIDFPQVPAIGTQWFSLTLLDNCSYSRQLAASRTFCVYEEVEQLRNVGLIKGGSLENAIVCSATKGWLNPPLRFQNEPCRHKILDLIGDLSLFAQSGNQGVPVAHIIAYKGGHALHADFVRRLLGDAPSV